MGRQRVRNAAEAEQLEKLGRMIRLARGEMSRKKLADRSCVSAGTIEKIESAQLNPSYTRLLAIAQALGVDTIDRLLSFETLYESSNPKPLYSELLQHLDPSNPDDLTSVREFEAGKCRELGQNIAFERTLTDPETPQNVLASAAGISRNTLSKIEAGVSNPSFTTVQAIAKALGIAIDELGLPARHASGSKNPKSIQPRNRQLDEKPAPNPLVATLAKLPDYRK